MKFSEMQYERPDLEALQKRYREITKQLASCRSADGQLALLYEHEAMNRAFSTMSSLAMIRHSVDTADAFYAEEMAFYDRNAPAFEAYVKAFQEALLSSKFRKELERTTGALFFQNMELSVKTFSPEIIPLCQEENELVTAYEKLLASAEIPFDGKVLNLSEIHVYQVSQDREIRKRAWEKTGAFFQEHAQELDAMYDKLVKNRTEQAKKLGYENFVQLGYDRLGRNCYGPKEVRAFRDQVVNELVPAIAEVKARQAQRLGIDHTCFYDNGNVFADGNPAPKGDMHAILKAAQKMYREMSPETGEFFDFMLENELFDLASKKGKQGGGYCTEIAAYRSPFIFSNFNGTVEDVNVITHEAGHAFAYYLARDMEIMENISPTMECCETHSMSMELLTRPWDRLFFEEELEKFQVFQLEEAISFIPYGCLVDEFQERMYEEPGHTPAQRRKVWLELEKKYRPWIDFTGTVYFEDGGGYQRQHHIYSFPFYYIDYCLAQTAALEFWGASEENWRDAFRRYLDFTKQAGTKTFVELLRRAKLKTPFEQGCIKAVCEKVMDWIDGKAAN